MLGSNHNKMGKTTWGNSGQSKLRFLSVLVLAFLLTMTTVKVLGQTPPGGNPGGSPTPTPSPGITPPTQGPTTPPPPPPPSTTTTTSGDGSGGVSGGGEIVIPFWTPSENNRICVRLQGTLDFDFCRRNPELSGCVCIEWQIKFW